MTHDQIARLSKSLEKEAARQSVCTPQESTNCSRRNTTVREISLGTILRRDRTYDRAF